MREWGWLTCFPFFFGLLIPSTLNHWHFPQVTFTGASVQLYLHKQATFLALLLGRAQVGVGEHMRVWTSHAGLWLTFLFCLCVFVPLLTPHPTPLAVPSFLLPFPYRPILNLSLFPDLLESCSMAGLEKGCRGHLATGVVNGSKGEETFPRKSSPLGRAMRLMSWQAHLCVP